MPCPWPPPLATAPAIFTTAQARIRRRRLQRAEVRVSLKIKKNFIIFIWILNLERRPSVFSEPEHPGQVLLGPDRGDEEEAGEGEGAQGGVGHAGLNFWILTLYSYQNSFWEIENVFFILG